MHLKLTFLAYIIQLMTDFLQLIQVSLCSDPHGGQLVVWLRFRPVDQRVAGLIPDSTNFLTNNSRTSY